MSKMSSPRSQTPRFNAACARLAVVYVLAGGATAPTFAQSSNAQISFTLATESAGLAHQFTPVTYPGMHGVMTGAAGVIDANNDGWPDLFVAGGGGVADRLFINNADADASTNTHATFTDRAAAWGVDARHRAGGVAVADVNGDGLDDLFVVSMGDLPGGANPTNSKLYINRGDHFENVALGAGLNRISTVTDGFGATFGDFDLDGDLDLFVSAWFENDGGNRLYRNDGIGADGVPLFSWVNAEFQLDTNRLRGFTPRFADMNGDRWPDLLLTNDFGTSRYFESLGDTGSGFPGFVDRTTEAGIDADCNGMGATVGDIDNDGDLDWYVSNIYFSPPSSNVCGNVLYRNDLNNLSGSGRFENVAPALDIDDAGWGWGTAMSDLDLDGDLDILCTSGWPNFANKPLRVYEQLAAGDEQNPDAAGAGMSFREVGAESGAAFTGQGRALVMFDADLDGDQDVYVVDNAGPSRFYRNDTVSDGSWLRVAVDTTSHPCLAPSGMHAVVRARVGERWFMRVMDGGITYLGQSEQVAHFGLGGASVVDEIVVEWSDGTDTVMTDVPVDRAITVVARHPMDLDASAGLNILDVIALINRVQMGDTSVDFDLDGDADLEDIFAGVALFQNQCAR